MENKEIIERIKEMAPQGKISCPDLRQLAEKLNIEYSQIGKICDEAGIKIYGCALGCF